MSLWYVEFSSNADDDLASLDRPVRRRVIDALEWLSGNFNDITPIPLGGSWKGFFKFRVGDWRVVYEIKATRRLLLVHYIDRRDTIYKRKK